MSTNERLVVLEKYCGYLRNILVQLVSSDYISRVVGGFPYVKTLDDFVEEYEQKEGKEING